METATYNQAALDAAMAQAVSNAYGKLLNVTDMASLAKSAYFGEALNASQTAFLSPLLRAAKDECTGGSLTGYESLRTSFVLEYLGNYKFPDTAESVANVGKAKKFEELTGAACDAALESKDWGGKVEAGKLAEFAYAVNCRAKEGLTLAERMRLTVDSENTIARDRAKNAANMAWSRLCSACGIPSGEFKLATEHKTKGAQKTSASRAKKDEAIAKVLEEASEMVEKAKGEGRDGVTIKTALETLKLAAKNGKELDVVIAAADKAGKAEKESKEKNAKRIAAVLSAIAKGVKAGEIASDTPEIVALVARYQHLVPIEGATVHHAPSDDADDAGEEMQEAA